MIHYRKATLEDKDWMTGRFQQSDLRGSEYCFTNQLLWQEHFSLEVAEVDGFLCTLYQTGTVEAKHEFPVGKGDPKQVLLNIIRDDRKKGKQTIFRGVHREQREWMEGNLPGIFKFSENRDEWDYLYLVEDLAQLKGRKYHGKRNHIAKFMKTNEWSYTPIDLNQVEECRKMYEEWMLQNMDRLEDTIEDERPVVEGCLNHFQRLGLQGGVLRQENRVVGFTLGAPLNTDTYIVHVEKAFGDVTGAYPMLNQQFVQHAMKGFSYVNREEDLGIEGLRKAKLSYHPIMFVEKYAARYLENKGGCL